jgi:NTE family protein
MIKTSPPTGYFFVNTLSTVHPFRLPYALGLLTLVLGMTACTTPTVQPSKPTPTPVAKAREPVIALALGGGGAKGFAHIGAIKVLESHGIKPKIVTGTSAGSFVGSIYASGKTPYQLQEIALSLEESDIRDLTFTKQGFLVGQKLQDYVNTQIGNKLIQQFPIRFAAVATQLDTGAKVSFNRGNAGQAVRASCSIPNVFIPATINGKRYVDGGLVSPIPVTTARDMGADIVIAIDISARPKAGQSSNVFGLLDQTLNIMGQQGIDSELKDADVVIKPAVGNLGVADLASRHQSILEGERAAQTQLKALDAAIARFKRSPAAFKPALAATL